jgi:hypothetical protein
MTSFIPCLEYDNVIHIPHETKPEQIYQEMLAHTGKCLMIPGNFYITNRNLIQEMPTTQWIKPGTISRFGHFVMDTHLDKKHPELFMFNTHRQLWEAAYLDPTFLRQKPPPYLEPIPYLFQFPLFTPLFCRDLIEEMENFGQWSGGDHIDNRLHGKYENVPTRDIHLRQIGLGEIWKEFIKIYIFPLTKTFFPGVLYKGTNIDFVVKYSMDGQKDLSPHHDSSSYSLNIALNQMGVDFEGGGTHFIKTGYYNKNQPVGHCLMHPGKVTHYHQGVAITKGTRYILVSFVE